MPVTSSEALAASSERGGRLSLIAACGAMAAALVALWPAHMEHWDEIQLELGMHHYDLAWHQPHPPGYVLFVLAGRLVGWLTHVAHPGRVLSLVAALSWIAWSLRVPEGLGRATRASLPAVLGLLLLTSPTLLLHATTGRTYMVESTLWVFILLTLVRRTRSPFLLGTLVGLGGGFRPTILGWGALAIAYWCWRERSALTGRDVAKLLASAALSCATWVVALAVSVGGLARYSELATPLLRDNVFAKSLFVKGPAHVFGERLPLMLEIVWTSLGPVLAITVALVVVRCTARGRALRPLDPLLWGSVVPFVFYLLLIFDADGYALSFVLPLLTWTVLAGAHLVDGRPPRILVASGAATVALLGLWSVLPGGLFSKRGVPATRQRNEERFAARRAALATLDDRSTLLVTGVEYHWGWSFRLLMYENPARPVLQLVHDPFFPLLSAEVPYLAAIDRQPRGIGPREVDLATLPFFSSERPLRHVVFANPKEATERMEPSCLQVAKALPAGPKEAFPVLEVGPQLRVFARNGRLSCRTS